MLKDIYPRMHSYEPRRSSGASSRLSHIFKCHCVPKKTQKKEALCTTHRVRYLICLHKQESLWRWTRKRLVQFLLEMGQFILQCLSTHCNFYSVYFFIFFLSASLLPTHTAWMYAHDSPRNNGAPCFREQPVSGVITACVLALCWPPPSTPECPCMASFLFWALRNVWNSGGFVTKIWL